jgi:hypothetical protein
MLIMQLAPEYPLRERDGPMHDPRHDRRMLDGGAAAHAKRN